MMPVLPVAHVVLACDALVEQQLREYRTLLAAA